MQHPLQITFDALDKLKNGKNDEEIAEVERLQRELYDAQVCNYRLNAQLGQLASKDWKKEASDLKVGLFFQPKISKKNCQKKLKAVKMILFSSF
uniref:Uncharacterized protein n=1 Tax=Panagrolaimus sp. JU765 TaxID=591449 RepID=A0AC34QSF7_9BILA